MEAAAIGRASIVTNAKAIRHCVDEQSGWTVEPRHAVQLASCICQALASNEFKTKGDAAAVIAQESFDRQKFDALLANELV